MASDDAIRFGYPNETGYVVSDTSAYGVVYGSPSGYNGVLTPGDVVRYDALELHRTDNGEGDLNGAASLLFYDSDPIAGHLSAVTMIGYDQGDAGIVQSIDSAIDHFTSGLSKTVEIVTTDGNTPGFPEEVDNWSTPSYTDYSFFVPELQFS